jgi:hypothetical protein
MLGGSAHVLRHNSIGRCVCVFDRGTIVYFCGTVLQPASFTHSSGRTKVWGPVSTLRSRLAVLGGLVSVFFVFLLLFVLLFVVMLVIGPPINLLTTKHECCCFFSLFEAFNYKNVF